MYPVKCNRAVANINRSGRGQVGLKSVPPTSRRRDVPGLNTVQSLEATRPPCGDVSSMEVRFTPKEAQLSAMPTQRIRCAVFVENHEPAKTREKWPRQRRRRYSVEYDLPPVESVLESASPFPALKVRRQQKYSTRYPRKRCRRQPRGVLRKREDSFSSIDSSSEESQRWQQQPAGPTQCSIDNDMSARNRGSNIDASGTIETSTDITTPLATGTADARSAATHGGTGKDSLEEDPQRHRLSVKTPSLEDDCGLNTRADSNPSVGSSLTALGSEGEGSALASPSRSSRRRRVRNSLGPESSLNGIAGKVPRAVNEVWSMTQNQMQRQMRVVMLEMRPEIARALEALAAEWDGKAESTGDLFEQEGPPQSDRDLNSILSRRELQRVLANRGLVMDDEETGSFMALFDPRGRGYVRVRDLRDGLRTIHAVRQLTQAKWREAEPFCKRRQPAPRRLHQLPRESSRVESGLLTPLVPNTSPSKEERSTRKQHRRVNNGKRVGARRLRLAKGVECLDITNPEIESLVDFLTGAEENAIKLGPSDGDDTTAHSEDEPKPTEEAGGDVGAKSSARSSLELSTRYNNDRNGEEPTECATEGSLLGANDHQRSSKSGQSERFYPLSAIIDSLTSAASRVPTKGGEDVRGPGSVAIPYSAARVHAILRGLQRSWRQEVQRRRTAEKNLLIESEPENFSDKELDATARFFDLDGSGHIRLEDVITVFREVRHDRCLEGRPSTPAMPILAALGRHFKENGFTATHFVQKAALCRQNGRCSGRARGLPPNITRPAKKAQVGMLLLEEMFLSPKQRDLVLDCIGSKDLVWGAQISTAIRRATTELSHRQLARREQRHNGRRAHSGAWEGTRGDAGSGMSHDALTASLTSIASPQRRRFVQEADAEAGGDGALAALPQPTNPHRQAQDIYLGGFNQPDAAMILEVFSAEAGGLRALTAGSAVGLWRDLKRRGRAINAFEAGCSSSRSLLELFRLRGLKSFNWFSGLHASSGAVKNGAAAPSVSVHAIISGVKRLAREARKSPPFGGTLLGTGGAGYSTADYRYGTHAPYKTKRGSVYKDGSSLPKIIDHGAWEWDKNRLSALVDHLDPCQKGSVTWAVFQERLRECGWERMIYPDAPKFAAASRFEVALHHLGFDDVDEAIRTLASGERGGAGLVEFVRRMGDGKVDIARGADVGAREDREIKPLTESERRKERTLALRKKLAHPDNAPVRNTIRRIDALMAMQGKRLVLEFHQADSDRSGGVDRAEFKQAVKNLVRPSPVLRLERNQRRKRQMQETITAREGKYWNVAFARKMEALHQSKASRFLEAVSDELLHRKLKIRDVFREVDEARSGALRVEDLLENTFRSLGLMLRPGEAEGLIEILDVNGNGAIECDELELAIRSYRRYRWERAHRNVRKPFLKEFPSLPCLFQRIPGSSRGDSRLPARSRKGCDGTEGGVPEVTREGIVAALDRLRGGSATTTRRLTKCSRRTEQQQKFHTSDTSARRQRMLSRAATKISHCCLNAGVRTGHGLAVTLSQFDMGATDADGREAGFMRAIDLWYWLRSLSVPKYHRGGDNYRGGGGRGEDNTAGAISQQGRLERRSQQQASCGGNGRGGRGGAAVAPAGVAVDTVVNRPLLNDEEVSLVLGAILSRQGPLAGGEGEVEGADLFASIPSFWNLLTHFDPLLLDEEVQRRLEDEQAEYINEAAEAKQNAATTIQCAIRRLQGGKRAADKKVRRAVEQIRREAAVRLQCAIRKRQAKNVRAHRLREIKCDPAATRVQAIARGRRVRHDPEIEKLRFARRTAEKAAG